MPSKRAEDSAPDVPFLCLPHLLEHQSKSIPDAPAILAPGRAPLAYGPLYEHIVDTRRALRAMGLGRHDRIAMVLPNGPEMAVAILAAAVSAACVPMNPAYTFEEFCRYFSQLHPRALITVGGIDAPARQAALACSIHVIELWSHADAEAGRFTLTGEHASAPPDTPVSGSDVALLLLTSGTTSQPKIVPLTQAGICTSAYKSVDALALKQTDRGINMMPLFHGHGLNNNMLASLAAGASLVFTPGCDVSRFFAWLQDFQPTWYSAVPTMHQSVLAKAQRNRRQKLAGRLRFIRSASAPLPIRTLAELEQTFETCVIESYGMTETASSFIACNPLPPRQRKPGSVGLPVGLNVAIMDERGTLLSPGKTGQVVVRGASVMAGYAGDQSATAAAFAGDWFKTGDVGLFDDDGYLFLAGRIREIINRGGEKIAPQEVDDVLLQHPAVAEAVTFAVPHATLGEDVASAVVLRPQGLATPKEIRQFAVGQIADFKVPRQVLILQEIPKGPTGKKQRVGLADKLGLGTAAAPLRTVVPPRTRLEQRLAEHWAELLQVAQIGIHDDFFASGGDSLLAADVLCHIYEITRVELEISRFFEGPTVAEVADHLEPMIHADQAPQPFTVIARVPRNGVLPASSAQERLCRLQHALAGLPFFNILYALRLESPCDASVLERSINEIVRRHEILRTTFDVIGDRYVQVIAPQLTVPLAVDDLQSTPHLNEQAAGHQIIQDEALYDFDLAKGPLIRTRLLRFVERRHLLLISMHQAICDGRSLGVFVEELVTLYEALSAQAEPHLPTLSYQYADFAHWQRTCKSHPKLVEQVAYWRKQLKAPLPLVTFATPDDTRTRDDLRTARRRWTLPASLVDAARRFGLREGGTLFMVLTAALKTLLHLNLGVEDLRVATNVANRNRPGTEVLIGPLANTLILRTNLGGDPSSHEVLHRVRATTLAAFDHQDLPFEELAEALEREQAIRPASLAQVMILFQNATLRSPSRIEAKLACEEADPNMILPLVTTTSFDVILAFVESSMGLAGTCIYRPHLFSIEEIDRLLQGYESVLSQMMKRPGQSISAIRVRDQ